MQDIDLITQYFCWCFYEPRGREFESLRARQSINGLASASPLSFLSATVPYLCLDSTHPPPERAEAIRTPNQMIREICLADSRRPRAGCARIPMDEPIEENSKGRA